MNAIEAIETRRAVKRFDPTYRIPEMDEKRLLQLALLSPTSLNIQNWRFTVVKDPALRREIRSVAWDQAQVTDASLLIVLCADLKAWEKHPARYWRLAPEEQREFLVTAIGNYFGGREQLQRDEAMRSCGIAAQTLMIAARAMGYDSCPMGGMDFGAVGKLIRLPADHVVGLMLAVGKALAPAYPRSGQLALEVVVFRDHF
jgi:nitroreductase